MILNTCILKYLNICTKRPWSVFSLIYISVFYFWSERLVNLYKAFLSNQGFQQVTSIHILFLFLFIYLKYLDLYCEAVENFNRKCSSWDFLVVIPKVSMAAAATPGVAEQTPGAAPRGAVPFDLSQAPNIEGFNPLPKVKDETFKEKFARKTKENPFVPIGELHKRRKALHRKVTTAVCYVLYFTQLC